MRNFFILCAATALASAVSLSQVNDNDYTGLDVVDEDYEDIEYDMYEQSADEQNDWETSLAQKSIFKRFTRKLRPIPTPRKRTNTGVDGAPEIGKPLRNRSFTGVNKVSRGRANGVDMGGSNRLSRSGSTGNIPDVNSIKINRSASIGGSAAPIRKLNRSKSVGAESSGALKKTDLDLPPTLNRQKGQFKPDGDMPAPGSLKLVRQNAMKPKNRLPVPEADVPGLKRNRITGKPDTRKVNKPRMAHFEKAMHAMTAVEITTTIAQMAQDHKNHKELLGAMDA